MSKTKQRFFIEIEYNDETSFNFYVEIEDKEYAILATLQMITRGTLQASSGCRAIAYNEDGFDVVSYVR